MARTESGQTEIVDAKTQLPRMIRDKLDQKAAAEGMRRATYLRRLIYRDVNREAAA